jgi:hypothetical protein
VVLDNGLAEVPSVIYPHGNVQGGSMGPGPVGGSTVLALACESLHQLKKPSILKPT